MTKSSHTHGNTKKSGLKTRRKKNLLVDHPAWAERLSEEWDYKKNEEMGIRPEDVTERNGRRVWWRCSSEHEWQTTVAHRTEGSKCPYCEGRRAVVGETDLQTLMPALAREWHPTKNGDLTPQDVTRSSGKKVWWKCDRDHEWKTRVVDRAKYGRGCPYCSGRFAIPGETDLATLMPELTKQWHPTKNGDLTPRDVTKRSNKKVWWKGGCGHEWQDTVNHRAEGRGCPYCAGKLPMPGETDLATLVPALTQEWHPTKNGDLTPQDITRGSGKKVWWRCGCGYEWQAAIYSRTSGRGCPQCASSHGEKDSAAWARSAGFVVEEQWRDPACCDQRPLPFDLMLFTPAGNALMEVAVVEYDGVQHSNPDAYFNMKSLTSGGGFDYVVRHDVIKTEFCESTGRVLIRVPHTVAGVKSIGAYIVEKLRENGLGWTLDNEKRTAA